MTGPVMQMAGSSDDCRKLVEGHGEPVAGGDGLIAPRTTLRAAIPVAMRFSVNWAAVCNQLKKPRPHRLPGA